MRIQFCNSIYTGNLHWFFTVNFSCIAKVPHGSLHQQASSIAYRISWQAKHIVNEVAFRLHSVFSVHLVPYFLTAANTGEIREKVERRREMTGTSVQKLLTLQHWSILIFCQGDWFVPSGRPILRDGRLPLSMTGIDPVWTWNIPHTCSELSYQIVMWNASGMQKHSHKTWSKENLKLGAGPYLSRSK